MSTRIIKEGSMLLVSNHPKSPFKAKFIMYRIDNYDQWSSCVIQTQDGRIHIIRNHRLNPIDSKGILDRVLCMEFQSKIKKGIK